MTDFEKKIKMALLEHDKSQKWLIEEVTRRTGLYFDRSYFCKIVSGENRNPKIIDAINDILELNKEGA